MSGTALIVTILGSVMLVIGAILAWVVFRGGRHKE